MHGKVYVKRKVFTIMLEERQRLADVPTPAGPTPRQIDVPADATLLPVVSVTV